MTISFEFSVDPEFRDTPQGRRADAVRRGDLWQLMFHGPTGAIRMSCGAHTVLQRSRSCEVWFFAAELMGEVRRARLDLRRDRRRWREVGLRDSGEHMRMRQGPHGFVQFASAHGQGPTGRDRRFVSTATLDDLQVTVDEFGLRVLEAMRDAHPVLGSSPELIARRGELEDEIAALRS